MHQFKRFQSFESNVDLLSRNNMSPNPQPFPLTMKRIRQSYPSDIWQMNDILVKGCSNYFNGYNLSNSRSSLTTKPRNCPTSSIRHLRIISKWPQQSSLKIISLCGTGLSPGFFSPIFRLQEQQNFRNLEFSKKSFHFDGGNLEFPLSLEEKSWFWVKNPWV